MGGLNLEVFKVRIPRAFQGQYQLTEGLQFGVYVMFPIGIMFYFGTNLDNRFAVPNFWPKAEESNKVPFDRDEIHAELERLRTRRLYLRDKRLAAERQQNPNQNDASQS
jgi:protein PET100